MEWERRDSNPVSTPQTAKSQQLAHEETGFLF
jgi:hypothetical protein